MCLLLLVFLVEECRNLPAKDPSGMIHAYVSLNFALSFPMIPQKTEWMENTSNPVFEEEFFL